MESILNYVFTVMGIYILLGFIFYLVFIFRLAEQLDENVRGSGIGFKLLILPGTLVLWPVLFLRWKRGNKN